MKIIIAAFIFLSSSALAQSMPAPNYGNCPSGSYSSGNSCVPKKGKMIFWNNGSSNCPGGWYSSSGYCVTEIK